MTQFLYALPSIILVGFANVLLKWRIDHLSRVHISLYSKDALRFIFDPYILTGALATAASVFWWLMIMAKVKVSVVYPIIQAGVIAMTILLSFAFLKERLSIGQCVGLAFLMTGVFITSKSS